MTTLEPGLPTPDKSEQQTVLRDNLLSLGGIASRYLIARTDETDYIARSLEHIVEEAENRVELQSLFEGITNPYERLFIEHAQQQPKRGRKDNLKGVGYVRVGKWKYDESTDAGILKTTVNYGFDSTRRGLQIVGANVNISSLNDAKANLRVNFSQNKIAALSLGWEEYSSARPRHPRSLLKKLEGTELGELIDLLIGPNEYKNARGEQALEISLGKNPVIKTTRECFYYPTDADKEGEWRFWANSDFQFHTGKNMFIRQHGLKAVSKDDNLTALSIQEAAIVSHQLLQLVPTVSL